MTSVASNGAPSRRERRRREIHERIVDAAVALLELKGFAGTTALEIAESADVAEKTFYNHFPTKQHLIEELAQRTLEVTNRLLAEARQFPGTTVERLRLFCERSADEAQKSRGLTREVLVEIVRLAQVDGVGPGHNRRLQVAIGSLFEEGHARGDIAPDRDIGFLSELGVAAYLGIMINWVTLPNFPLRERLRQLTDLAGELLEHGATPRIEEVRQ